MLALVVRSIRISVPCSLRSDSHASIKHVHLNPAHQAHPIHDRRSAQACLIFLQQSSDIYTQDLVFWMKVKKSLEVSLSTVYTPRTSLRGG
jgi:hypothetical protein